MAVHAQFAGLLAGCLPPCVAGGLDYGALLSAAAGNKGYQYACVAGVVSAAQSELTCNGGGGGGGVPPARKRGREDELGFEQYVASSSAALLPIRRVAVAQQQSPAAIANRTLDSTLASTSGRPATTASAAAENALVAELCVERHITMKSKTTRTRTKERTALSLHKSFPVCCLPLTLSAYIFPFSFSSSVSFNCRIE